MNLSELNKRKEDFIEAVSTLPTEENLSVLESGQSKPQKPNSHLFKLAALTCAILIPSLSFLITKRANKETPKNLDSELSLKSQPLTLPRELASEKIVINYGYTLVIDVSKIMLEALPQDSYDPTQIRVIQAIPFQQEPGKEGNFIELVIASIDPKHLGSNLMPHVKFTEMINNYPSRNPPMAYRGKQAIIPIANLHNKEIYPLLFPDLKPDNILIIPLKRIVTLDEITARLPGDENSKKMILKEVRRSCEAIKYGKISRCLTLIVGDTYAK